MDAWLGIITRVRWARWSDRCRAASPAARPPRSVISSIQLNQPTNQLNQPANQPRAA